MQYKYFKHNRCGKTSTAGEWNNATLKLFGNSRPRQPSVKTFRKIQHAVGQHRWYICPKCGGKAYMKDVTPLMKSEVA